ncbi:ATP-binding protein [Desulfogranum japonicum]|uniref:ATP-binding protein n=1 Tax=Desulfogranum japonicum TaxID=231447 RepID=UPI0003F9BF3A|nr:ATP-binding protein [Desulfogranum japonicum]
MRSIFLKFFLSVFITVVFSSVISSIVTYSISHRSLENVRERFHAHFTTNLARSLVVMGKSAYIVYESQGQEAFTSFVHEMQDSMRTDIVLFIDGTVIGHHKGSDSQVAFMAQKAADLPGLQIEEVSSLLYAAKQYQTQSGQHYVVVGVHEFMPPPRPGIQGPPPRKPEPGSLHVTGMNSKTGIVIRLIILGLIASLVCFGLARSFSLPIRRLRSASRQIAEGDLTARVGPMRGFAGRELAELAHDFDEMATQMQSLVETQKRLIRDISHELRSPLARLHVALELTRTQDPKIIGSMLNRIEKEAQRLNVLIGELLTLTRIEHGSELGGKDDVHLDELIRDLIKDVRFEFSNSLKAVELLHVDQLHLQGNKELLHRALENVLRNAVYYTADKTVVEIALRKVDGEENDGQGWAEITIRDHGPGIPENELAYVTKPFYRVSSARDRQSGGTGIGLSITAKAVSLHNGQITITNADVGSGLLVVIRLPISQGSECT